MTHSIKDVFADVLALADGVLNDNSNGYLARAEEDYEWFFDMKKTFDGNYESDEQKYDPRRQFGQLWAGKDYAFRVLFTQANRQRFVDELLSVERLSLSKEEGQLVFELLGALARDQNPQVVMEVDYDDACFWEEFLGELVYFYDSGEINEDRLQ